MKRMIKSAYNGLDGRIGDLHIDLTNTGYLEDSYLLIEGENEFGYQDGTDFTITAYDVNGNELGTKRFNFLDIWYSK